ncbi:MAG: CHASE3 domain-containing protein [Pseudomonadota bacterium]
MRIIRLSLRGKLIGQGLIPIVLLVGLASLSLYSVGLLLESANEVDLTHKTIRQTMEIREQAVEMQTGMRGFLLTGEDKLLGEFSQGEKKIADEFGSLRKAGGTSAKAGALEEAEGIIFSWKNEVAEPAIALRKEIGSAKDMNEMADLVRQGMSRRHYENLRAKMEALIRLEKGSLAGRQKEQARERDPARLRDVIAAVDYGNMVIGDALQALLLVDELHRVQLWYVLSGKEEFLAQYQDAKKKAFAMIEQVKESVADNPQQVKTLDETAAIFKDWMNTVLEPEMKTRGEIAKSKTMMDMKAYVNKGEDKIRFDKFKQVMDAFRAREDSLMADRRKTADHTASLTRKLLAAGTVVAVFVALLIAIVLSGRIVRPLFKAVSLAESIGEGDLSRTIEVNTRDEVGKLCKALNSMVENLRSQINRVMLAVDVLVSESAEVAATVAQVAASTAQTSSALTELTTTVEEVKGSARVASDMAKGVAKSARESVQVAEAGKKFTENTIEKMNLIKDQMESIGETVVRLSEHSRQIGAIIATVQDIADQSNLLAVNASIEAARAGDQGKGFAVVAQEIKSLADQSRQATEQVRTILEDTGKWVSAVVMATEQGSKAVQSGVEQSVRSGEVIGTLSGGVVSSSQSASVIQTASEQQSVGVEQVSDAMVTIEQAMRRISDSTGQLEAAAQKLSELGGVLKHSVRHYKL